MNNKIKDCHIRQLLHQQIKCNMLIDELPLYNLKSRIDIAALGDILEGYEIKSEADTLKRLPNQIEVYNKTLSKITIVTCNNHLKEITNIIPEWWGIQLVFKTENKMIIKTTRESKLNNYRDKIAMGLCLSKEEALSILIEHNLSKGVKSKNREIVINRLANSFDINQLEKLIIEKIKKRYMP